MRQFCKKIRRSWKKNYRYGFRGNDFAIDNFPKININLQVLQKLIQSKVTSKAATKAQMNNSCPSKGWLEKFMSQNGLLLCRHTTQAQKAPE